jgi:hypothetical protein
MTWRDLAGKLCWMEKCVCVGLCILIGDSGTEFQVPTQWWVWGMILLGMCVVWYRKE